MQDSYDNSFHYKLCLERLSGYLTCAIAEVSASGLGCLVLELKKRSRAPGDIGTEQTFVLSPRFTFPGKVNMLLASYPHKARPSAS